MPTVHLVVGVSLFLTNLVAGIWGITAWLTRRPTVIFWYLLRAAQVMIVVQATLGLILLMSNYEAANNIHYLYGILPIPIMLITEMMRVGAAQKVVGEIDYEKLPEDEAQKLAMQIFIAETRVMALGCLIIAALALRAGTTSGHTFLGL
jgi:ABC-type phosphate transport system auxiliary subunit